MNISLSEVLLVLVVAVVVIKPEQLPGAAFKIGRWVKQTRKGLAQLRREWEGTAPSLKEVVSLQVLPDNAEMPDDVRKS